MDAFFAGLAAVADPQILFLVFAGTVLGVVVGALPGISGSTTTALLLPLTIAMTPNAAIAFLGSIYCAANFGGSITAILINTPGDPSASATAFDGYPLAKRGEAGRALGISAVASAIGGIFSVIVLIIFAPVLARLAYQFGPPEYFALALFGLSMVAAVGGDSPVKNLMAAASGVLIATVGLDLTTGVERFTFGMPALSDGIGFIPVLIGLFAMAELLERAAQRGVVQEYVKLNSVKLPTLADFRKCWKAISLSNVIGTFIGILPALGATTAALICYNETKRWSKHKEEFWQWRSMTGVVWSVENPAARFVLWGVFFLGWLTVLVGTSLINHFDLFGLRQVYLYQRGEQYTELGFRTPFLYKIVRHPIMLGFIMAFWATPDMTVGHLVFALATTAYILIAIQLEERDIVSAHGKDYEDYRKRVSMLLPIPKKS